MLSLRSAVLVAAALRLCCAIRVLPQLEEPGGRGALAAYGAPRGGPAGYSLDPAPEGKPLPLAPRSPADALLEQEAKVSAVVERMKARLRRAGRRAGVGRAWARGAREVAVVAGVEKWQEHRLERAAVERRFVADKASGKFTTKIFFEHVTHSGGTEFCSLLGQNEKVIQPTLACMNLHTAGAPWTESTWQLGRTGGEVESFAAAHAGDWNAIANEELMPDDPVFGKTFMYFGLLRNPYSRHMTDCKRKNDTLLHVNSFNHIPLDNYETRHFCGESCRNVTFGQLTNEHLQKALNNLAHFSFVGPTEYGHCFNLLRTKFSWDVSRWRDNLEDLTVSTRDAAKALRQLERSGDTAALEDFLTMHSYDEILYNTAKQICLLAM